MDDMGCSCFIFTSWKLKVGSLKLAEFEMGRVFEFLFEGKCIYLLRRKRWEENTLSYGRIFYVKRRWCVMAHGL